ncbi:DUF1059 domain-containing protein [Pelagicoccus albus]|uniref:DUF1059 domain-containing protein n=1 Tax=Pelagicoccus albus TaxID=415222 RepID=A0A7X1B9Y4_9BACT|nr:DUF1059 domain-containing protein [Pelagicoccus albus]MBC2608049.1 DUF1059 domain-containing protein [Pelagicoccus albus]
MKRVTCEQVGGACDHVFEAETFEELVEKSKAHGMEMLQQGDAAHMQAMQKMMVLMQSPEEMNKWMDERRKEFEALPEV